MFDIDEIASEPTFDDLCRLCAKYDSVKISVFSDEGKRRELLRKIHSCLPFKIEENDGLPKSLCFKCVFNLENSYEFRDRCIQVNQNLEKQLQQKENTEKNSIAPTNSRKIRPEVSIFAIPPSHSNLSEEKVQSDSVLAEVDGIPNPLDYLKVDVDESISENNFDNRTKSNNENKKQYVWNADKRWLSVEHKPLHSDQKAEVKINSKPSELSHDDNNLSRRKNNNPRKIAREMENDSQFAKPSSSNANGIAVSASDQFASSTASSTPSRSPPKDNNNTQTDDLDKSNASSLSAIVSVIEDPKESADESKTYTCLLCEQIFTQRSSLNKHFSATHGIEPYEVMTQTPLLSQALRPYPQSQPDEQLVESLMEQETVIFCEVCRREFQDRASLWLHMVHAHREEASVSCGICLKICCDNITLIEHVNTAHSGDKAVIQRRYSCQVCGRQHDSRQKLLKHATLHTLIDNQGQTILPEEMISLNNAFAPRECPICHKKFFNEEKLNQHTQNFHAHHDGQESLTLTTTAAASAGAATTVSQSPSIIYKCELCASPHANRMDRWWHVYHAHNGDRRVTCDYGACRKIFVTQTLRDEHASTHHQAQGDFTNTCEVCGKLWESRTVFYKHMMNVHPKCLPSICGVCMKIFSNVPELREHVRVDHAPLDESPDICCDVCGRPYAERSKMLRHRRVHNVTDGVPAAANVVKRKDDLICSACPELLFERLEEIGDHRRTVHKLFVCDLCPKFYNGNNHLWKHVSKQHKGDPNVTCNLCLRTSASRAHLDRHKIKYHSDPVDKLMSRPSPADAAPQVHECNLCGKIFRIRSLLKKHLKSCKGAKLVAPKMQPVNGVFPCAKCGKTFEQQSVLSKHMRNSHVVHFCEACGPEPKVGFDAKTELLAHIRARHADDPELVCDVDGCNKVLRLKADLQKHKQEHLRGYFTYICDMCGDMFSNRKKLRKHLLTFHKAHVQHLCAVCVAILSSVDELSAHVQAAHAVLLHRPYTCQICGKCYPVPSKLLDHVAKTHGPQYKPCRRCWKLFADEQLLAEHVQNHPPAEEKPPPPPPAAKREQPSSSVAAVTASQRVRSKSSTLAQELSALGIVIDSNENGKRPADDESFDGDEDGAGNGGKRLRKKYKCTLCKDTFRSVHELKEHQLETHGNSRVNATATTDAYADVVAAAPAAATYPAADVSALAGVGDPKSDRWTDYSPIECDCCGKSWNSKKQLWQHLIRSHPQQSMHTCGICLQVCKSYGDLWYHLDAYHSSILNEPTGRFACYVCGHYHNSQSKLDKHIGVHKQPPLPTEYRCPYCRRRYRSADYLRHHVRLHEATSGVVNAPPPPPPLLQPPSSLPPPPSLLPRKQTSSEFGAFSIDSILSTASAEVAAAAAVAARAEDDIMEVDEYDDDEDEEVVVAAAEKADDDEGAALEEDEEEVVDGDDDEEEEEEDDDIEKVDDDDGDAVDDEDGGDEDDDLVELERNANESDADSNSSLKGGNAFRGYENDDDVDGDANAAAVAAQSPRTSAGRHISQLLASAELRQRADDRRHRRRRSGGDGGGSSSSGDRSVERVMPTLTRIRTDDEYEVAEAEVERRVDEARAVAAVATAAGNDVDLESHLSFSSVELNSNDDEDDVDDDDEEEEGAEDDEEDEEEEEEDDDDDEEVADADNGDVVVFNGRQETGASVSSMDAYHRAGSATTNNNQKQDRPLVDKQSHVSFRSSNGGKYFHRLADY